jgi:hypothetical protein
MDETVQGHKRKTVNATLHSISYIMASSQVVAAIG